MSSSQQRPPGGGDGGGPPRGDKPPSAPPGSSAAGDDPTTTLVARRDASGRALALSRRPPELRWSDRAGEHAVQLEGTALVGSAASADVVVDEPTVSRLHAELEVRDDGLWVRDLGSTNGTWIDHVRVTAGRLEHGARLRLGEAAITVTYAATPRAVKLWPEDRFGPLLGRSTVMRALFARLARVAASDATVLIQGETGTGKELVARAIHDASPRGGFEGGTPPPGGGTAPRPPGPFIVVDCAALPESLLEAELFGHAKGAFTGAVGARAGAFESAHGGTVFLDEIGELPLAMQPKLLRVLESRTVRRLGEAAHRTVDVRLVSATHRDLRAMVNQGAFREDLFFRLAVLPVEIPPLRARAEDVPLLAARFVPAGAAPLDPALLDEIARRAWPGNVRELRNFVERATVLGAHEALGLEEQQSAAAATGSSAGSDAAAPGAGALPLATELPYREAREHWLDVLEREYLRALLARFGGRVADVVEHAGVHKTYVYRLIRKHGL